MEVVLVDPQIPQNTGSIARTCAACNVKLIVVGKPAFEISDKKAKRAGLDYWPHVNLEILDSWEEYYKNCQSRQIWYFSKFGTNAYHTISYNKNDTLVFGSETKGLGKEFLTKVPASNILKIPISNNNVRSLNLSNAVSIALYEALRSSGVLNEK